MCEQERLERLSAIAQQDDVVQVWRITRQSLSEQFWSFANQQPAEIRNMLWGYAESGRLEYQRMVNLACIHMAFCGDEKDGGICPSGQSSHP